MASAIDVLIAWYPLNVVGIVNWVVRSVRVYTYNSGRGRLIVVLPSLYSINFLILFRRFYRVFFFVFSPNGRTPAYLACAGQNCPDKVFTLPKVSARTGENRQFRYPPSHGRSTVEGTRYSFKNRPLCSKLHFKILFSDHYSNFFFCHNKHGTRQYEKFQKRVCVTVITFLF